MACKADSESKSIIKLGKQGIVYEKRDEFESSIFRKIYERAFELTELSVRSQRDKWFNKQPHEQHDNIITFVGRRGTGKTSSMLSFMKCLRENGLDRDPETKAKTEFIALDWIDASLMEKGEDIFEIILAKMLGEILDKDEDGYQSGMDFRYETRDLHQKFGAIYKKVLDLKRRSSGKSYGDEIAISALRELARSNDLRDEFEKLVEQYIQVQCLKSGRRNTSDTFLVVAIDDVDMNVESGFEILEKIQRYLKVDRLIVLLAINYEQMLICCEKHFSKVYSEHSGYAPETKNQYVSQIAEEYMDKALPSYMRLYLPSLKKKDYDRRILAVDEVGTERNLKQTAFFLAEKKLKVRYDSEGRKRHFLEPNSLRNLNSQYIFQRQMFDLDEEDEKFLEKLDMNFRKKMDDLLFRYTFENLELKERKFFTDLSEEDIRRRGELIVSKFLGELNKRLNGKDKNNTLLYAKKTKSGELTHEFQTEFRIYGYSYGALLRCFYFLGREKVFEKKLVHAFLDMYTIILTRAFYHYKDAELPGKSEQDDCYEMIKEILAGSSAGTWSLYLVPMMKLPNVSSEVYNYSGAVKGAQLENTGFITDKESLKLLTLLEKKADQDSMPEEIAELIEKLTPQIIMLLFLSDFRLELLSGQKKYGLEKEDPGEGRRPAVDPLEVVDPDGTQNNAQEETAVRYKFGKVRADFNVLNFINNIFIFEEIVDNFIQEIYCLIKKDIEDPKAQKSQQVQAMADLAKKVKLILQENEASFYRQMTDWKLKYGGMVVPVYATDIYYNMLKRLERKRKKSPVHNMLEDQLFLYLQKLLLDIKDHLARNDKYYREAAEVTKEKTAENTGKQAEEEKGMYTLAFEECPVIKWLLESKDNKVKDIYNSVVASVIKSDNENEPLYEFDTLRMLMD